MSANWFTYKFYFKNRDARNKIKQLVKDVKYDRAVDALGMRQALGEQEDVEHFSVSSRYFSLQIHASTSVNLNHRLIKAGKELGTEFVKVDVYYDQVGEEERNYLYRGKIVTGEKLNSLLAKYEPGAKLQELIEDSNSTELARQLEQGHNPNTLVDGQPLLFIAHDRQELSIFKLLLEKGANPNIANNKDVSILEHLIEYHDRDEIPYIMALMNKNLDLNKTLSDGSSPLWHAWALDKCIAEIFLIRKAEFVKPKDVYVDQDDEEILYTAIQHNDVDIIDTKLSSLSNDNDVLQKVAHACCEVDQLTYFKKLIEKGLKPFAESGSDTDLLIAAANGQSLEILHFLLQLAIDEKIDLHDASQSLYETIAGNPMAHNALQLLSKFGDKPDNNYVLYDAISHQATKNVKVLLDAGCPLSNEDDDSNLLHQLLGELNGEITKLLVNAGVDPLEKDDYGKSVIERALNDLNIDRAVQSVFMEYLVKLPVDERIWLTILNDNVDLFRECWNELDDKDIRNEQEQNLLIFSASSNADAITEFLLQQDIDVQETDSLGNTAIASAVVSGNANICRQLLQAGASANDKVCIAESDDDNDDEVAILKMMGMDEINEFSKAMGDMTEPVSITGNECSCLMSAVAEGNLELVKVLFEFDADVTVVDGEGNGVLYYAVTNNHKTIVATLLDKGADINSESDTKGNLLMVATYRELPEMCQLLVEKGLDLNKRSGRNSDTALMVAACVGVLQEEDMTSKLLSLGARINIRNDEEKSALICACENFNFDAAARLLSKKAHTNFVDCYGKTAYDYFLKAEVDTADYDIDVEALKPKSGLIKFVKVAKLMKRFFIRSVIPALILIMAVGWFSDSWAHYVMYIILAWWGFKFLKMIVKKYVKPKPKTKAESGFGLAMNAISNAMEEAEKQQKEEQEIIDSWDEDKVKATGK